MDDILWNQDEGKDPCFGSFFVGRRLDMNDWNHNGTYDSQDSFIDYHLSNSSSGGGSSSGGSGDGMKIFWVVLLCIGIFRLIAC